jgi:hypothetical protein
MAEGPVSPQAHWDGVYAQRDPRELSWFEPAPEISLALIEPAGVARDRAIVDIAGGRSGLAAALLADGYTDVTVADISAASLYAAATTLRADVERVRWLTADVRSHDFGRRYDLWHDRAVFHFMVTTPDRDAYLETLRRRLRRAGTRSSPRSAQPARPVQRTAHPPLRLARADTAARPRLPPGGLSLHEHRTPSGQRQQFLYLLARRRPRP